jgi:hypothetical protein
MSENSFEIIAPELNFDNSDIVAMVSQVESPKLVENQNDRFDLGWEGASFVIITGFLLLKAFHGPSPRNR